MLEKLFRGLPNPGTQAFAELIEFSDRFKSDLLRELPCFTSLIARHHSFADAYKVSYTHSGKRLYLPKDKVRFERKIGIALSTQSYDDILILSQGEPNIEIPSSWGVFTAVRKVAIQVYLNHSKSKQNAQLYFGTNRKFIDKLTKNPAVPRPLDPSLSHDGGATVPITEKSLKS